MELLYQMSYMSTYYDVLPQLLHNLLDYIIQHTTYLLSRGLLSSTSRPMYANPSLAPTSRWYCVQALRSDPSDKYTTLSHTNWQVGLVLRSAPPVTLCLLVLPLRGLKPTFFPTHLLHCYNHRSYQWSHPHGCEQACIDEPLLAQSCRRILLWVYHYTYSNEAMPPIFTNLYITDKYPVPPSL